MDLKEIFEVLDKLTNDPKAQELLKSYAKPEPGKEAAVYAEVAAKLGYNVTEADITSYTETITESMKRRSEDTIDKIESLPDENLGQVAGGKGQHPACADTYLDRENCWSNDGCDNLWNNYPDYICHIVNYKSSCQATASAARCGAKEEYYKCGMPY